MEIKLKGVVRMKTQAKIDCTIYRWRVAWMVMGEIHQPRMRREVHNTDEAMAAE